MQESANVLRKEIKKEVYLLFSEILSEFKKKNCGHVNMLLEISINE